MRMLLLTELHRDVFQRHFCMEYRMRQSLAGGANPHTEIVFAQIGAITEIKAQDIFVEAIRRLPDDERSRAHFLIIGRPGKAGFVNRVYEAAEGIPQIEFTGNYEREKIKEVFQKIDVVVCPSREDTMPIVITEAMMHGKACVCSTNVGMAQYITDGREGFVCEALDAQDLSDKLSYFIRHPEVTTLMGRHGRELYEKYFTMEKFGERLLQTLEETNEHFKKQESPNLGNGETVKSS